jgi:peptidoglycan/xylan/chitin deacetylase (PgdA/CDA1 family)
VSLRSELRRGATRGYLHARIVRGRLRGGGWSGVRILGYHRIADAADPLAVHPVRFRRQMELVRASGAEAVPLAAALDELAAGPVHGRYVCVTFDDAYRDNLEAAAPVLRSLGIPATIFVPTDVLDGTATYWWYADPPPALTWDEVRELDAEGLVRFGSHTCTHPHLPKVDDAQARDEVTRSRAVLAERLGHAVDTFCYPAGLYCEREVALVREAGYRAGLTTDPGVNRGDGDPLRLKRTLLYRDDGERVFQAKLDGLVDEPSSLLRHLRARRSRAVA